MKTERSKQIQIAALCALSFAVMSSLPAAGEPVEMESSSRTEAQRIFYTPTVEKTGYMWDVWVHHHEGKYFLYYLSGSKDGRGFDNISLAVSGDGITWREHGVVVPLSQTARGMGSCGVWESKSDKLPKFLMNLMEFRQDRGKVMFTLGSEDLVQWEDLGEKTTFGPDPRWYEEKGRWVGISVVQGLYIENGSGCGTALMILPHGVTQIGAMTAENKQFRMDSFVNRMERYGTNPSFRLLLRNSQLEFYVNERCIQCYSMPGNATGRIGIIHNGDPETIGELKAWN